MNGRKEHKPPLIKRRMLEATDKRKEAIEGNLGRRRFTYLDNSSSSSDENYVPFECPIIIKGEYMIQPSKLCMASQSCSVENRALW